MYCKNCDHKVEANEKFCSNCGKPIESDNPSSSNLTNHFDSVENDSYWREEFKKIESSNEAYKGKWNWAAFFFGGFWAFYKGLWQLGVLTIVLALLFSESYIIPLLAWLLLGWRGNYFYYRLKKYGEQLPKNFDFLN